MQSAASSCVCVASVAALCIRVLFPDQTGTEAIPRINGCVGTLHSAVENGDSTRAADARLEWEENEAAGNRIGLFLHVSGREQGGGQNVSPFRVIRGMCPCDKTPGAPSPRHAPMPGMSCSPANPGLP